MIVENGAGSDGSMVISIMVGQAVTLAEDDNVPKKIMIRKYFVKYFIL